MPIQPVAANPGSRDVTLLSRANPLDQRFGTVHEIFDWLRGLAASPEERALLDLEEPLFLARTGAEEILPSNGLTARSLLDWALRDVSPFDANPPRPESVETIDALKSLLARHLRHKKTTDFDRILYLRRSIDHEKVRPDGTPKPPVEPAVRDVQTYHAGYNDRTAYLKKKGPP